MQKYLYSVMTGQAHGAGAGCLRLILRLLSFVYGMIVRIIPLGYRAGILRRYHLDKPVISIGNITWGGVGKTPLVECTAEFIKQQDFKPVVLTRGYKGKQIDGRLMNDEAVTLESALDDVPVVAGRDRVKGAKDILKKQAVDVFLLDDGFQHWRLKRDMDIVAVDATNPWGNGFLIPRGILRESLSALSRADCFVITKADIGRAAVEDIKKRLQAVNPQAPVVETIHSPECFEGLRNTEELDLTFVKGEAVCAFCSIGDPESFEKTVRSFGAHLTKTFSFRDHHWYTPGDIQEMVDYCRSKNIQYIITTSKDAAKLREHADLFGDDLHCLILKVKIQMLHGKEEFFDRISRLLHR